jgi:hypothetical protein
LPCLLIAESQESLKDLAALNACVTQETNQNLSVAQKELLKTHFKFGHQGMRNLQRLLRTGALGNSPLQRAMGRCDIPKCASCEYGKAKRRPVRSKRTKSIVDKELSKEICTRDRRSLWITLSSQVMAGYSILEGASPLTSGTRED